MFVFLMDKGKLVRLDSKLGTQNVSNLRNWLSDEMGLPLDRQILLISGGFQLDPRDQLSEFGAGMDQTNPIYVFTRAVADDQGVTQSPDVLEVNDGGIPRHIEELLQAPPSVAAMQDRLVAVRKLAPVARETCVAIEQLVSEQRQMVQGWQVALANLAECAAHLDKRRRTAATRFAHFDERASEWEKKLQQVQKLKQDLSQIPLSQQLIQPLCESWSRDITSSYSNTPVVPINLYEWICIQSTGSSSLWPLGSRLRSAINSGPRPADSLSNLPGRPTGGRMRTTSAGQLDTPAETMPLPMLLPASSPRNTAPPLIQETLLSSRNSAEFYLHHSQQSLPSLLALNASSSGTSPSWTRRSGVTHVVAAGLASTDSPHGAQPPPQTQSPIDYELLATIQMAQRELELVCYGEVRSEGSSIGPGTTAQPSYSIRLTNELAALIALVHPVPVVKSTVPSKDDATYYSASTSVTDYESNLVVGESAAAAAGSSRVIGQAFALLDPHLVDSTCQALDHVDFSQLLARLSPLHDNASHLVQLIDSVEKQLVSSYQVVMSTNDPVVLSDKFVQHTHRLRDVLDAFKHLCDIFTQTMNDKLYLAEKLRARQQWLQQFQSTINRLDSGIHLCLTRMDRVIKAGTLVSHLQSAPELYVRCLIEIVRQHEFDARISRAARELRVSKTDEQKRRRQFALELRDHILHSLFAPWTFGLRANRCSGSRLNSHGSSRTLNILDSEEANSIRTTSGMRLPPTSSTRLHHYHPSSSSVGTSAVAVGLGYRSEPRLDELVKVHPNNTFRPSTSGRSVRSGAPALLKEVQEDETEGISSSAVAAVPLRHSVASPPREKTYSGPAATMDSIGINPRAPLDTSRRTSMPVMMEVELDPLKTPSSISTIETPVTEITDIPFSRQDLIRLAEQLPPQFSEMIQEALQTLHIMSATTVIPGTTGGGQSITAQHVGLSPVVRSTNESSTSSSSMGGVNRKMSTDIACQTLEPSVPRTQQSPSRLWTVNSHSTSLVFDETGSPQRPLLGWEQAPSSLCSWEFCPGPANRLKRSNSTTALLDFPSRSTKQTQTEEDQQSQEKQHQTGEPLDSSHSSSEVEASRVLQRPRLSTDRDDVEQGASSDDAWVRTEVSQVKPPHPEDTTAPPSVTKSKSKVMSTSTQLTDKPPLMLEPFPMDEVGGGDLDYATPTTMMTSSFHSTRTNLSFSDDLVVNVMDGESGHMGEVGSRGDSPDSHAAIHVPSVETYDGDDDDNVVDGTPKQRRMRPIGVDCGTQYPWSQVTEFSDSVMDHESCLCTLLELRSLCLHWNSRLTPMRLEAQTALLSNRLGAESSDNTLMQLSTKMMAFTDATLPIIVCPIHGRRGNSEPKHVEQTTQSSPIVPRHPMPSLNTSNWYETVFKSVDIQTEFKREDKSTHVSNPSTPPPPPSLASVSGSSAASSPNSTNRGQAKRRQRTKPPNRPVRSSVSTPSPETPDKLDKTSSPDSTMDSASSRVRHDASSVGVGAGSVPSCLALPASSPVTGPISLSSVHALRRFFTFAHSNFTPNDTVLFVPVSGSMPRHSSTLAPDDAMHLLQAPSSSHPLKSLSPTSSMLSSTIIESMELSTTSCVAGSHRHTTTPSPPMTESLLSASYYPHHPSLTGSTTGSGQNLSHSRRALYKDLFDSTMGQLLGPSSQTRLNQPSPQRPPTTTNSTATRSMTADSTTAVASVTQWRMLSSDGLVYFLHRDDFGPLQLDPQVDYCRPVLSATTSGAGKMQTSSGGGGGAQGRVLGSTTAKPVPSASDQEGNPTVQSLPGPRSYFVVATFQRKERCLSKRDDNRFNLPKNFSFYRVRAKPLMQLQLDTQLASIPRST